MRLRLPRWLRRTPAPRGRHVRTTAPVTVPGAGGALVAAAVTPFLVAEAGAPEAVALSGPGTDPALPVADLRPVGPPPVTPGDLGVPTEPHPSLAAPHAPAPTAPAEDPPSTPAPPPASSGPMAAPLEGAAPAEPPEPLENPEPTVGLGFADGDVLELAADDPRLAGFQDAAAAVLGHERT